MTNIIKSFHTAVSSLKTPAISPPLTHTALVPMSGPWFPWPGSLVLAHVWCLMYHRICLRKHCAWEAGQALIIWRWYYHCDISVKLNLTETCLSSSGSLYGQWSCYFGRQRKYLIWADNGGGMWRCAAEDRGQLCRVTMMTMPHDGPTRWPL